MRFNIVIPFYKDYDTIEPLLDSILDQDHKDFDVTIVIDGKDDKAHKQLSALLLKEQHCFNLEMLKKNGGASAARNYGAAISKEDLRADNRAGVLFFIDADCKLSPGILYDFSTQFELNKKIDFCYGNYRFGMDQPPFLSQDYDPYLLETMNYISTMSPVKRAAFEEVGGFDEDRKYFQDWGLFYKLAKAGKKGQYLGDKYFVFTTVPPDENSISGNVKLSLAEKSAEFRKYYGISDKRIVASTWGAPLQAIQRAKILEADYAGLAMGSDRMVFPANFAFDNWEYTYMVGCYNSSIQALENHMVSIYGRPIYHFIGTDVFDMMNVHPMAALLDIQKMFKSQKAIVLSNSPRCQKELALCGIKTELVYTPIYDIKRFKVTKPLPEKFTVAVLISKTNRAHKLDGAYGYSNIPLIIEVAKSMPDIEFKFFGIENMNDKQGNIEYCGRIPQEKMVSFINSCSMVLRATIHDGFPQLPIQFMLCGRQALVSCPDESMKYAEKLSFEDNLAWEKNKNEIIQKIYDMSYKVKLQRPRLEEIQQYYQGLMSAETFKQKIYELAKPIRRKKPAGAQKAKKEEKE